MATLVDVVPTSAHVDERLAHALTARATALAPATLTVDELLGTLHARYLPDQRLAPPGLERLCLSRALRRARRREPDTETENSGGEHPTTLDAMARALDAVRRHGLGPDDLARAAGEIPADDERAHARIHTLREALMAVDEALAARGYVPAAALEVRLAAALGAPDAADKLPEPLGPGPCVLRFVCAQGADPARVGLVAALARVLALRGGRVEMHVLCEPRRERTPPSVDRALRALEDLDGLPVELSLGLREPEAPPAVPALESLLESLAVGGRCEAAPVSLADAHGPDEEARWVATRIEHWLAEGYAPHEIAVVLRECTPEALAPLARALDDARVPWQCPAGATLLHASLARALLTLPAVAARGALRDDVVHAHAVLAGHGAGPAGAPLHRVAHALRQLNVESLFDPDLDVRLREPRRALPEAVVREALALRDAVRALLPPADAATHVARLRGYAARVAGLARYRAESHAVMASAGYDPGARAILRAIGRDEAALRVALALLDELPALLAAAGYAGEITLDEFAEALAVVAAARSLPPAAGHAGGVAVLPAREAAGRSVRALAVLGVNDGGFPAYTQDDPFVGDAERRAILRATGKYLDRPFGREEETLVFLAALACATDTLALSAVRHDAGGRALPPSPFMVDARRATGAAPAHVRHDPLARSRDVPPRGPERAMRAWAQAPDAPPAPLAPSLRSVRARTEIESERREFFTGARPEPGKYTGRLDHDPVVLEALDLRGYASARRPVDVTMLERAARCGFKAFAEEILGLEAPEEPAVTLDATERGHLLHALVEAGQHALAASRGRGRLEQITIVAQALDAAGEAFVLREPAADADLLRAELLSVRRQVETWLSRRMEVQDRWEMLFTEVAFGPSKKWPALEVPVDGGDAIVIKGRIDGVEAMDGGVRVVEFKSGRGDGFRKRLREGALDTQFQLVIYAAALSRASQHGAVPRAAQSGPVDGLYVGFRDQSEHGLRDVLSRVQDENGERAFDVDAIVAEGARGEGALANAVRRAILPLREGRFPARPRDCDFCGAASLCRIEHAEGRGDE